MMESTLPPPVVGEDDKASLHRSDAQQTAGQSEAIAEAAVAAAPTNGMPPALEPVTVSELLAAQELTTTAFVATSPAEGDKRDEAGSPEEPGIAEPAGVAEIAAAEETGAPAGESAIFTVAAEHPAETDSKPSPPPVGAADPGHADGDSPRPPIAATDAVASLSPDAGTAAGAVAPTAADAQPAADPPAAGTDTEPHAPAAAPDPIAVDRVPSLTEALEDAARMAADAETMAAAAAERAEPVPDAPPSPVPAPLPAAGAGVQPLTSAFDAAVKLAADANAAAEALESLKRLLQRQQQGVAVGLAPPPASPADSEAWTAAPLKRAEPPPLPSPALAASDDGGADGMPDDEPQLPVPLTRKRTPERVRFDLRGFLAGFALSWAFGVVLYLFMTAG